jgi:hypothetical protein
MQEDHSMIGWTRGEEKGERIVIYSYDGKYEAPRLLFLFLSLSHPQPGSHRLRGGASTPPGISLIQRVAVNPRELGTGR